MLLPWLLASAAVRSCTYVCVSVVGIRGHHNRAGKEQKHIEESTKRFRNCQWFFIGLLKQYLKKKSRKPRRSSENCRSKERRGGRHVLFKIFFQQTPAVTHVFFYLLRGRETPRPTLTRGTDAVIRDEFSRCRMKGQFTRRYSSRDRKCVERYRPWKGNMVSQSSNPLTRIRFLLLAWSHSYKYRWRHYFTNSNFGRGSNLFFTPEQNIISSSQ